MFRHQHLTLEHRKPVAIHVDGPSQTRIDRILVHGAGKKVYIRGDDEVNDKTEPTDLGFPIKGEFSGGEYGTNQGIYLVSDTDGKVQVDVLVVGNG